MGAFMADLRSKKGVSARALEFTILTATRTSETIGARWSEIAEVDISNGESKRIWVWTIPAERMKAGKDHRVPLSDRAIAILAELPREGEHVFAGARKGAPLSNMAMLELVRGMRGKGATVHGLRSTFRDWAAEQTSYPNEMCEIALAHSIGDKAEAAYRRGDMMEKRRRLMADWAAYCSGPSAARDKVVSIRESA
jgi:integrase